MSGLVDIGSSTTIPPVLVNRPERRQGFIVSRDSAETGDLTLAACNGWISADFGSMTGIDATVRVRTIVSDWADTPAAFSAHSDLHHVEVGLVNRSVDEGRAEVLAMGMSPRDIRDNALASLRRMERKWDEYLTVETRLLDLDLD